MSDAGKVRQQGLDKFYTKDEISKKCISSLETKFNISDFDLIVEPSAGNGSFSNKLDKYNLLSLDIQPESNNIIQMDFFDFDIAKFGNYTNILTIGNPPFGKNSSLAVKFFNKAAEFSNVIAFIIPKTFRKNSILDRINLNFHLVFDEDIPSSPSSFIPSLNVKCCFQIYKKMSNKRSKSVKILNHPDFEFLSFGPKDTKNQPTPPTNADFAIRAYGSSVGKIFKTGLSELRPKSYHWIKSNIDIEKLIKNFQTLDYVNSNNTARQCSIGKSELISLYNRREER